MFKPNNQPELFSFETELSEIQQQLLSCSKEKWFYHLILGNIEENNFKPLYSDKASRPNVAVNILVSALILKELKAISYDELMESVMFDLRFKTALGLTKIDNVPFSRGTLFNFQNRILEHEQQTGINLIEQVFDNLTKQQIKELLLKANIQRTDSTLISSNIKKYSRVQLLIEVLLRLERILDKTDKALFTTKLQAYSKNGSGKYVYGLKSKDLPHELEKLGKLYHAIHIQIKDKYDNEQEFINFERVYKEHFVVIEQQVGVKRGNELHSGMLQSPDDQDATYRKKKEEESKGYTINATETASPENPIQLINDIAVNPNNIDDSKILNQQIDTIKDKTPEIEEIHTDGGYGSEDNDDKFEELEITQITTAIRGRESEIEKEIKQTGKTPNTYTVECPNQKVTSVPTKKRNKAAFDIGICNECALKEKCLIFKEKGKYYFTHNNYLSNKRNRNIRNIPIERRKLRPNVEATMKEFKTRTRNGKIKVRGIFKTNLFAFNVGIAINFGRIYRYIANNEINQMQILANYFIIVQNFIKKAILIFLNRKFRIVIIKSFFLKNMCI